MIDPALPSTHSAAKECVVAADGRSPTSARAVIDGIGCAGPVRRSDQGVEDLALTAIAAALADAELRPCDVQAIIIESALCPVATPPDRIAVAAGMTGLRRTAQSTPVGAGILAAVGMAVDMVERGEADTVLTWFATGWGSASAGPTDFHARMEAKHLIENPVGFTGPPLYFAVAAKRYQYVHGLSDAAVEAMLFDIAAAVRANALLHPGAQLRKTLSYRAYQDSPMVAEPLRTADCSLLSDGAVAMVISRHGRVRRRRPEAALTAWSYAVDPITDADIYTQSPWLPDLPAAGRAANDAFAKAGLSRQDIDVLGLYDCFSIAVAMQLEALGFCPPGKACDLVANGALRADGVLPTNTHGGLIAHGYLLGVSHVAEIVSQLRGEAGERQVPQAQRGFAGAGPGRQYTALILDRVEP